MKNQVALWSALISILCAPAAAGAAPSPSQMKTILVLGNSLSAGFGLKSSQAYPALLAKKLRAAGLNFQVTNASQTGGTTEGGLERLPAHLKRKIDIFILELGINDAFRGVPVDQIQNNLQQMIDKVKARNPDVRVLIAGMQLPNYAADDYVFAFGKMFAELAAKNGGSLVPYLLDGVHPRTSCARSSEPVAAALVVAVKLSAGGWDRTVPCSMLIWPRKHSGHSF